MEWIATIKEMLSKENCEEILNWTCNYPDFSILIEMFEKSACRAVSVDEDLSKIVMENWKGLMDYIKETKDKYSSIFWLMYLSTESRARSFSEAVSAALADQATEEDQNYLLDLNLDEFLEEYLMRYICAATKFSKVQLRILNSDVECIEITYAVADIISGGNTSEEVMRVIADWLLHNYRDNWKKVNWDYCSSMEEEIGKIVDNYNSQLDKLGYDLPKLNFEEFFK